MTEDSNPPKPRNRNHNRRRPVTTVDHPMRFYPSPWSMLEDLDRIFGLRSRWPPAQSQPMSLHEADDFSQILVDMYDDGEQYIVEADLPGIDKKNVDLEIAGDRLRIHATKDDLIEEEGRNYLRRERLRRNYQREIDLPDEVLPKKATATMMNGILQLMLPKREPTEQAAVYKIDVL